MWFMPLLDRIAGVWTNWRRRTNMSRPTRALAALAAFISITVAQAPAMAQTQVPTDDVVVANVEGMPIYRNAMLRAFGGLPPKIQENGIEAIYATLLERMIQQKLLILMGRKDNLATDPQVVARLKDLEDVVIGEIYLSRLIEQNMTPGFLEQQFQEYLKQNPPTEKIHARHILLKTETDAKNTIDQIAAGKKFEDAAREYSTGPSAANGGDLGFFKRPDMVKAFSDAAFAMRDGEISKTPVKTRFGWHVIQVVARTKEKAPSFEQMKPQLMRKAGRNVAIEIMEKMVDRANVERFTFAGKALPPVPMPKSR
jgi:peptidyl-prolyl cis-trans isomerase C